MAGSLSFLGLFTQEAILAFSRWVWIDGERAATLGKDHERRESGRYSLGRRSGRTCPLWPSCRKPCGKHEGESLKHKKGVDRRVGRGVAGRQGYSDAGPGSAGRSATDGPQPCPSGDLCPLLTCSAWVYHTIFCFSSACHISSFLQFIRIVSVSMCLALTLAAYPGESPSCWRAAVRAQCCPAALESHLFLSISS